MHTYKIFFQFFLAFILFFFLYNAIVWKLCTEDLLTSKNFNGGDLARLGYVAGSKYYRKDSMDLPRRHIELEDYKGGRDDVLVIGDSFSNGGGGGNNRYYQDYIASFNNFSVMNIEPYQDLDFITLAACYANNGFLDKIKPRYLLISSSEKFCIERFSNAVDLDRNLSMAQLATLKRYGFRSSGEKSTAKEKKQPLGMINDGNFKYLLYKIYYHFSDHAFFSKTYMKQLSAPLFSVKDSTTLLFFRDDIRGIGYSTPDAIGRINENLNRLADKLASKGIKLYFMPCVDKYDLYSDFIVNNNYPKNPFFDLLRPLPKRYTMIDTKAILLPELKKGVRDIFFADDTHWSWKASEKIFRTVRFDRD
jgi:hypothetical protein